MSFKRIRSFRTKSFLEHNGNESSVNVALTTTLVSCKQNSDVPNDLETCVRENVKWEKDNQGVILNDCNQFETASCTYKNVELVNNADDGIEVIPDVDTTAYNDQLIHSKTDHRP